MNRGQNTDFPEVKMLYYNIQELFGKFHALGPQILILCVKDPRKMVKMKKKIVTGPLLVQYPILATKI